MILAIKQESDTSSKEEHEDKLETIDPSNSAKKTRFSIANEPFLLFRRSKIFYTEKSLCLSLKTCNCCCEIKATSASNTPECVPSVRMNIKTETNISNELILCQFLSDILDQIQSISLNCRFEHFFDSTSIRQTYSS